MGSIGKGTSNTSNNTGSEVTDTRYEIVNIRDKYKNSEQAYNDGVRPVNDFTLSTLFREGNIIGYDFDPLNNYSKWFLWDKDFKYWVQVAGKSWRK